MVSFLYNLVGIIYDVSNFDRHQFRGLIKRKSRNIRKYFLRNDAKSNAYKEIKDVMNTLRHSHSEERLKFMNLHFQDLQEYKPNIYHGRITLFRADYQPFLSSFDPDNCWGKYATEGVDTINIPNANHNNFFTELYVTIIAKELAKRITDLDSSKTKGKR